jgi:hypothetical protein
VTADEQGYNGWTNYPTWAVNLWLSNDEGLYNATRELIAAPIDLLGAESSYVYVEPERRRRIVAADRLKGWVRDELAPDLGATFAADLLGYALDGVDWFEIADAWLEDLPEDLSALPSRPATRPERPRDRGYSTETPPRRPRGACSRESRTEIPKSWTPCRARRLAANGQEIRRRATSSSPSG